MKEWIYHAWIHDYIALRNEWMNEWTMINERMNECTMINVRMNEWIKEWMNEWIYHASPNNRRLHWMKNVGIKEYLYWMNNDWMYWIMNEWWVTKSMVCIYLVYPCTCAEWMNEPWLMKEWMNAPWLMKEWTNESKNEWTNESKNEWMNEWMNERIINYRIIEYPCSTCAGRRPAGPCRSCLGRTLTQTPGQQPRPVHQTLDLWFALIAIMYIEPWKPSHAQFEKLFEIIYSCLPFPFFAHHTSIFSFLFPFFSFSLLFFPSPSFISFFYLSSSKASQIILKSYTRKFIQPCFIAISLV